MADLQVCNPSTETLWVTLKLKQTRPQYMGLVCRPLDGDLEQSLELANDHVMAVRASGNCNIMLIGDVNVDWGRSRDGRTKKLKDFYKVAGLTNLIKDLTCHHNDSNTCVDHVSVTRDEMYQCHGVDRVSVTRDEMYQCHGVICLNASDPNFIYAVLKLRSHMNYLGLVISQFQSNTI